ncbi:Type II secretion system protein M domain-containing protein [Candidatus Magnetomoraceae bacterium gMMP-15]
MKLGKREKIYVSVGISFAVVVLLLQLVILPIFNQKDLLERNLRVRQNTLSQVTALQREYEEIKQKAAEAEKQFSRRKSNFTLFSFLDKLAGSTGIKNHVNYMKPSTSKDKNSPYKISLVEMKLQNITIEQLSSYLYRVETSKNHVTVRRISITQASKNEGYLNAVLQVVTLET